MSQQPPEPSPPPGYGGPPPPRKKRHGVPNRGILLGIGILGIGTFIVIIGTTLGRGGGVGYSGSAASASREQCQCGGRRGRFRTASHVTPDASVAPNLRGIHHRRVFVERRP